MCAFYFVLHIHTFIVHTHEAQLVKSSLNEYNSVIIYTCRSKPVWLTLWKHKRRYFIDFWLPNSIGFHSVDNKNIS